MNEQQAKAAKKRATRAKQILEDPLFDQAFSDIRGLLYDKIAGSDFKEGKEREDCYFMLRAIESLKGQFERHINTGRAAEATLAQKVIKRVQEL